MQKKFEIRLMEPKTLMWWISRREKIDMNPPYQRSGKLWSKTDKAYLIDSILNGFDIPKLYMADFTWGESNLNISKLPYAVIDGKQRLEAIFDFFDGTINLHEDFLLLRDPSLKIGGFSYKQLKEKYIEIAEEFDNFNLNIMSVYTDFEGFINEMFVRLNRSVPLNGAEIRNAMSGPAVDLIRHLAKHIFFSTFIKFKIDRSTDKDIAAKLLMIEYHDKLLETKKRNLDEFVEESKDFDTRQLELAGRRVSEILTDLTSIFLPKDAILNSSGIIPVYYWFTRDIEEKHYPQIRDFLESVEDERKRNLKLVSKNPQSKEINQDFVQFNSYYRSPNDASSHEGRYMFLKTRFQKAVKNS